LLSPPEAIPVRSIVFLAIAGFASQAMVRVTDSLLPAMASDFDVSVGSVAMVVTTYGIGHGLSQLFLGSGGNALGKYRAVALTCGLAALFVFACGLMPTVESLAVVRFLSGVFAGWIIPLGMAYVGDVTPYDQRQQVLGRYLTGNISGLLFGQAAGGVLGDWFGWRNVFFLLAGLLAIAAIGVTWEYLTNPRTHEPKHPDQKSRGMIAEYTTVLSSSWARIVILAVAIEGAMFWGVFAYIGADLHLRFNLSLSTIGIIVGTFAIGGLIYVGSINVLVRRLGQRGLTIIGGVILGVCFLVLAAGFAWWLAPVAVTAIGFGFYMLHNTLQTNATQMTPQARGTALAIFSSALYLSQSAGVGVFSFVIDRVGAVPMFVVAAIVLPALGWWFARELEKHAEQAE